MPHQHEYHPMRNIGLGPGPPIDYASLSRYTGALLDGCGGCRLAELEAIAEDPITVGGFVSLVAVGARRVYGDHALESLRNPSTPSAGDAAVAALLADNAALQYEPVFAAAQAMGLDGRRAAVETGARLLVKLLGSLPGPRPPALAAARRARIARLPGKRASADG